MHYELYTMQLYVRRNSIRGWHMAKERSRLRLRFNEDAALYDQARPGYPAAMLDDVVALADMPAGGRILEIGPGTGQVTLPWAQRGYRIVAVELGADMAMVARQKLADFPLVQIHVGAFEDWPVEPGAFDLVFSATAFHWIDPAVRYRKAALALKQGGALALCWNKHVQLPASRGFFEACQPFYNRAFPEHDFQGLLLPEDLPSAEKVRSSIRAFLAMWRCARISGSRSTMPRAISICSTPIPTIAACRPINASACSTASAN